MSGKPWSPERRLAFAAAMKRRWRKGVYAKRPTTIDPEKRAAASERMKALNERMRTDEALKRKCVKGQKRVRRRPEFRAMRAQVMAEIMSKPENRERARQHACAINRDPAVRKKQWDSRRRKQAPPAPAVEAPPRPQVTGNVNAVFLELLAGEAKRRSELPA